MWLVSMLLRQPAFQGLRACSAPTKQFVKSRRNHSALAVPGSLLPTALPGSTATAVSTSHILGQQQQPSQHGARSMATATICQADLLVAVSDATQDAATHTKQQNSLASNARLVRQDAAAVAAAASQLSAAAGMTSNLTAEHQDSHQLHQQQQGTAVASAAESFSTQLLHIDPAALPDAAAPNSDLAQHILTAAAAPDLSRGACPHLYYDFPQQWESCNPGAADHSTCAQAHNSEQQQQQLYHTSSSFSGADAVLQAAALLRDGLPVAIPTETVYGLAGNALSASAVASIFGAKGRPADNPLIVHISDLNMLAQLYPKTKPLAGQPSEQHPDPHSHIPQQYHRLIAAFWPGPLTILLPASPLIPAAVTAGHSTMAVRMPAHPVARAVIAAAGVPLAAPSANTSGKPSPTTAQHVVEDLAGKVPAVVDGGGCGCGVESTVLDGLRAPPVVLRPGGVTPESIAMAPEMAGLQVYSRDFTDKKLEATPTTPGMKYRHYSPTAPVLLLDPTAAWQQQQDGQQQQQQQQQSSVELQQAMTAATQKLLRQVQQGQLQQSTAAAAAAAAAGWGGPSLQRVVLLRSCSITSSSNSCETVEDVKSSSSSSNSRSPGQDGMVGWTPDSLARIQQQQQQHLAVQATSTSSSNGSSSSSVEVLEYVLGSWQQLEVVAQQLFSALRAADHAGAQLIVVQGVLPVGAGLAVMNRLHKAASMSVAVGADLSAARRL